MEAPLSRRERERIQRRNEMISAARSIFARIGYAQTTLEEVAELAEFGKGTIYNYFPNKEALFASVLEETFRGFSTIFAIFNVFSHYTTTLLFFVGRGYRTIYLVDFGMFIL